MSNPSPLVSTQWLADHLNDPSVRVLDASWHLPAANRDPQAEFEAAHIPGAQFFDIDGIAAPGTDLPHMAAAPDLFAERVGALGVSDTNTIVVYDTVGLFSAARAWWNFRVMGAQNVMVLDGGLPKWRVESREISNLAQQPRSAKFTPTPISDTIISATMVQEYLSDKTAQIVDVRPAQRFTGETAEARPGLRSGHMPGALNLPFTDLVIDGRLASVETLNKLIADAGIDTTQKVVTSCGSGVTAPLLNLALARLGINTLNVYDGSWAEWGARDELPVIGGKA